MSKQRSTLCKQHSTLSKESFDLQCSIRQCCFNVVAGVDGALDLVATASTAQITLDQFLRNFLVANVTGKSDRRLVTGYRACRQQ